MIRLLPLLSGLLVGLMLAPVGASGQSACTHYAAPTGSGQVCTAAQPCRVDRFWALARPGTVLCLRDGTFRGADQMITPPAGLRGTEGKPITVRAEHDGQVLLDAQGSGFAVLLGWHSGTSTSNDWFVVEGVNATRGREAVYQVSGADNLLRRVIGYHGTQGQADANIFRIVGYRSRAEDCAGWGNNSRKIMDGAQSGNLQGAGFRRCWAEWNDHPQGVSNPNNTYELGYNSFNQLYENVIGTWDTKGQTAEIEGVLHMFGSNDPAKPHAMQGSKVLGSIFYAAPGQRVPATSLVGAYGLAGMLVKDVAAIASPEHAQVMAFYFGNYLCTGDKPCVANRCENCLAVTPGTPVWNDPSSGWTTPGLRQGATVEAATGGESAFTLLPGLCREYVGGELTDKPLWPWPMNDRIKAARVASGFAAVDVTAQVEALLGPIPAACKGGGTEPPIPPEPPVVGGTPLACTGILGEGGAVAVACVPQSDRR